MPAAKDQTRLQICTMWLDLSLSACRLSLNKQSCPARRLHLHHLTMIFIGGSRERGIGSPDPPPAKSQVAIFFLRITSMDPLETLSNSNCFSRKVRRTLCKICWWLEKRLPGPYLMEFSGSTHDFTYMSRDTWFPTMWHFDMCITSYKPVQPPFKLRI